MTTAIATMTAIAASAAGTREQSGGVAAPRDREMQCSYERRRWLRDGGRGGAGLSRRGACCCGVSIVIFFILFFWAPRAGKESSRRAAAFFSFAAIGEMVIRKVITGDIITW